MTGGPKAHAVPAISSCGGLQPDMQPPSCAPGAVPGRQLVRTSSESNRAHRTIADRLLSLPPPQWHRIKWQGTMPHTAHKYYSMTQQHLTS